MDSENVKQPPEYNEEQWKIAFNVLSNAFRKELMDALYKSPTGKKKLLAATALQAFQQGVIAGVTLSAYAGVQQEAYEQAEKLKAFTKG